MSLRAIVDIVLHLESFRNIDLFQQGLYHLKFEIFHLLSGQKFSASPYNQYSNESNSSTSIPGGIDDIYYKSQSFYIKYCDEEIEINEIAVFRTEVEINNEAAIPPLIIQGSLMYCDIGGRVSERVLKTFMDSPPEFKKEAVADIEISSFIKGANSFVPIIFDDQHFCVMNSTVHVIVIDFRFRPTPQLLLPQDPNKPPQELNIANSLSEIFFPPPVDLTPELIDSVHNKYIKLISSGQTKNSLLMNHWRKFLNSKSLPEPEDSFDWSISTDDPSNPENSNESFCSKLDDFDPAKISEIILAEIQVIAGNMNYLLFEFTDILMKASKAITVSLMYSYNTLLKDRWGESIFKKKCQVESFNQLAEQNLNSMHKAAARALRTGETYLNMEKLPIFLKSYFPPPDLHPILFLDIYSKLQIDDEKWNPSCVKFSYVRIKPVHLVVFVHGFQGNSFDVRLIRNQVALCRPDTLLMCSHMNEGETEGDIDQMGERLSEEVLQYIHEWCPKNSLKKISFIGHSLGGLIIRASLPHLKSLSSKFEFLITFSSPHLGYMYNTSKLVDAGMWIIKKWKKSLSLKQLSMTDTNDAKSSFLYKLTTLEGIEWFKNIALVGAHQDNYAPFESARIEVGEKAVGDAKGRLYIEMANNLLGRIQAEKILRIDVNLKLKSKSIDSMIGRAAHIQMLDNHILVQMVLHCCSHFFD
jgi:pimeloyl-ACP methyl ester carboxylesterase